MIEFLFVLSQDCLRLGERDGGVEEERDSLFACLCVPARRCVSVCLSVCLSVSLSVYLTVCLSVYECVYVYESLCMTGNQHQLRLARSGPFEDRNQH